MKFKIRLEDNVVTLMRRCGYSFQKHAGDEMAFVRPIGNTNFPRFHIYAREDGFGILIISIHLDAKKETYGNQAMHGGEYGGDGALGPEVERLKSLFDVVE